MEFQTSNNLPFEIAPSHYNIFNIKGLDEHVLFKVGTCNGQYGNTKDSYYILSVVNHQSGNGHLNDVFEWFEHSCKRDNKNLMVLECLNKQFYDHLIAKRGFIPLDAFKDNCIKVFNKKAYKRLLRDGNEILIKGTLTCK